MLSLSIERHLADFTLDVAWEAGDEVVALFGPSGAGKTLTLHCLAGLVHPDRGRIVVNGTVLYDGERGIDVPTRHRRLGYVFQGYALFPHLSVAGNVGYGLHDRSRAERRQRVQEVMERLGLAELAARRPHELSGGQQQRVALGRALAVDPELLLLDEPLSALDAPLRRQLRQELVGIVREWGKATVLVTHDLAEAFQLADRVVIYEGGRVVQEAPKAELLSAPASERVAHLMGVRNVLSGTVLKAASDRIQFRWRGQTLEAVNSPRSSYLPEPGASLAFFIRPEYVRLIRKDRGAADAHHMNLMTGRVVGEADFGTTWTLYFRLDEPGSPAQGEHDLEIEVPRLVYEILDIARDRHWQLSIHRGSIHVLPS
ncbi:MAG TPA: ABC transporter ATP-binding protein [Methylomirabilota bacterium]|jgi:molybdate transport system ATP-binding protein|nr:ABC transporter ATP-binding protein [Methylomirabilota bacterium]